MSFLSLLINVCTVRRYVVGVPDAYGKEAEVWADHLVNQPCRISYPKGRQIQRGTEVVPIDVLLFLEDVDVTEADRIIFPGFIPPWVPGTDFDILFVAQLQDGVAGHHLELSLGRTKQ